MSGVVTLAPSTTRAVRDDVDAACRMLSLRAVSWRAGDTLDARTRLVVASLPAGERAIPRDAVEASERAGEHTRLLLVAEEGLVRPTVTLQGGRVTMLSKPASPERLRGVLRMLAAPPPPAPRREALTRSAWVATTLAEAALSVGDDVVAAVIQFDEIGEDALREAVATLATHRGQAGVSEAARALGASAGAFAFDAAARELAVYWPRADRAAWVCSPLRLPMAADLAMAAAGAPGSVIRLSAASGDVVVALAAPNAAAAEMEQMAGDGAAALVDRLRAQTAPGLVMEVR